MVLWILESPDNSKRIGIISSKKVHNRAHKRNRARRCVRDVYRNIRYKIVCDNDVVIVIRKPLLSATRNEIYEEMNLLFLKSGLIKKIKDQESNSNSN